MTGQAKKQKLKGGRARTVYMDEETRKRLLRFGAGCVSYGIRKAAREAERALYGSARDGEDHCADH